MKMASARCSSSVVAATTATHVVSSSLQWSLAYRIEADIHMPLPDRRCYYCSSSSSSSSSSIQGRSASLQQHHHQQQQQVKLQVQQLILIITALLLLLSPNCCIPVVMTMPVHDALSPLQQQQQQQHLCVTVIDAGSTHSGLHHFGVWTQSPENKQHVPLGDSSISPGLGTAWLEAETPREYAMYVYNILDQIRIFWRSGSADGGGSGGGGGGDDGDGGDAQQCTGDIILMLKATAGMRALGPVEAARALVMAQSLAMDTEGIKIVGDFSVISGKDEATFAFLAANAARDDSTGTTEEGSIPVVDLGGGSTQIAVPVSGPMPGARAVPQSSSSSSSSSSSRKNNIIINSNGGSGGGMFGNGDVNAKGKVASQQRASQWIYVQSFLGYGLERSFRATLARSKLDASEEAKWSSTLHPLAACRPGRASSYDSCARVVRQTLAGLNLMASPWGRGTTAIAQKSSSLNEPWPKRIIALSAFWHIMRKLSSPGKKGSPAADISTSFHTTDLDSSAESMTLASFRGRVVAYCAAATPEAHAMQPASSHSHSICGCYAGTYALELLAAYGCRAETVIEPVDIGWARGLLITVLQQGRLDDASLTAASPVLATGSSVLSRAMDNRPIVFGITWPLVISVAIVVALSMPVALFLMRYRLPGKASLPRLQLSV